MKKTSYSVCLLGCATALGLSWAFGAESEASSGSRPAARDLVASLAVAQAKIQSFIVMSEDTIEAFGPSFDWGKSTALNEFRFDGRTWRSNFRKTFWGQLGNTIIDRERPGYTSQLWDGETYYTYSRDTNAPERDQLVVDQNNKNAQFEAIRMLRTAFAGATLLGCFYGCSEPITPALSRSNVPIIVKPRERLGEVQCEVLEAKIKDGLFTLWLDPSHGYNIARAEMLKNPGDAFLNGQMPRTSRIRQTVKDVRFEQVDGIWVAMEANVQLVCEDSTDPDDYRKNSTTRTHHRKTLVRLNPDFEALAAFKPDDIREGTRCSFSMGQRQSVRQYYRWKAGKLVPEATE